MTLIAFHVQPHRADIITDTLSYSSNASEISTGALKAHPLPQIDAVTLSQGAMELGAVWRYFVNMQLPPNFDSLEQLAVENLPALGAEIGLPGHMVDPGPAVDDAVVFQIGYSADSGRFKASAYSRRQNWQQHDVTDLLVCMPLLISDHDGHPPRSVDQWIALAQRVRNERALAPIGLKVIVGGEVFHTVLERGAVTQRKVHTFDDTGEEFRRIVAGTDHPDAQLDDCTCGSGRLAVLCHTWPPGKACNCRSGQQFEDCCKVTPEQILAARASRRELAAQASR